MKQDIITAVEQAICRAYEDQRTGSLDCCQDFMVRALEECRKAIEELDV